MDKKLVYKMEEKYENYLSDESKLVGKADSISFPENEEEIIEIIRLMNDQNVCITVQGGKTGIVGCAVPSQGHIMNLSNMNKVKEFTKTDEDNFSLKVEPGITLIELKKAIRRLNFNGELFWPPDPTETSATVGGIASCNAQGICSYMYGDSKKYIESIRIIQDNGQAKQITRGETIITFLGHKKDLLDVYLGGEGMFGVITELTLKLQLKPKEVWGISFFFENKVDLFDFVEAVIKNELGVEEAGIAAIEYIDRNTIDEIECRKEFMTKLKQFPDVDKEFLGMIYIEIHGNNEESVEKIAEMLMEISMECNSDPDKAWAVSGDIEIEKMRDFRHAAAESTNLFIETVKQEQPNITKLGTDMSLEGEKFGDVITQYENDIKKYGLKACIFGHIAGNHLHVNILPKNYEEYQKGRNLLNKWAEETVKKHGKIVMEHGIGKLKKDMFLNTVSKDYIQEIKRLKNNYDCFGIWNPNNMF